jgi:hypothetical protein
VEAAVADAAGLGADGVGRLLALDDDDALGVEPVQDMC